MDDKLLSKVCYYMTAMAGFIRLMMPNAYELLFNFEEEFDNDEMEIILDLAEKSMNIKDVDELRQAVESLASKEENDG